MEKLFDPLICNEIYKHEWKSNIKKVNEEIEKPRITFNDGELHITCNDPIQLYNSYMQFEVKCIEVKGKNGEPLGNIDPRALFDFNFTVNT